MSEHEVIITAEDGCFTTRFVCNAPSTSMCHAVWTCDCETFYRSGIRHGMPAHQPDYENPDRWHAGTFDPDFCNLRDWYEADDEGLSGEVTVPVEANFEGDYYAFTIGGAA